MNTDISKESLEDAANKNTSQYSDIDERYASKTDFIAGANYQQQKDSIIIKVTIYVLGQGSYKPPKKNPKKKKGICNWC